MLWRLHGATLGCTLGGLGMNGFLEGESGVKEMYQRESIKTAK